MSKEEKNSLEELVDLDELQSIQDSFAKTVGTSSVIFSPEGEPLTQFSNSTGFCSLIQSTEEGKRRCFQSFMEMSKKAMDLKEQKILYCFAHGGHILSHRLSSMASTKERCSPGNLYHRSSPRSN